MTGLGVHILTVICRVVLRTIKKTEYRRTQLVF